MSRFTESKLVWTLTVLRHGGQGFTGELETAEFRFARRKEEMEGSPTRTLSRGLISLLEGSGHADEAMESGFVVEMRRSPTHVTGWRPFTMLAGHLSWSPGCGNPRSAYALDDGNETVELVDTSVCSFHNQLPTRIWIRVAPLTLPTIAWALSSGVYACPEGDQRTLNDWVDLSHFPAPKKAKELVLPGPPQREYQFL